MHDFVRLLIGVSSRIFESADVGFRIAVKSMHLMLVALDGVLGMHWAGQKYERNEYDDVRHKTSFTARLQLRVFAACENFAGRRFQGRESTSKYVSPRSAWFD
jgi:hypothetical protein